MAERPEDLNLPLSVITRIMKDAIPEGVSVSKEARNAVSKAASVFVLYATSCANTHALKSKRKTLNATDVFAALDDMEFSEFTEPLRANLEVFRASLKNKKEASEQRKKNKEEQDTSKEEEEGEEDDEEEDEDVDDEDDMDDDDEDDDGDDDDVEEVDDGGEGGSEVAGEGAGEELVTVEDEEAESPEVEEIVDT